MRSYHNFTSILPAYFYLFLDNYFLLFLFSCHFLYYLIRNIEIILYIFVGFDFQETFLFFFQCKLQYYKKINRLMGKKKVEVQYGPRIRLKGQLHNPGKWTKSQNKRYIAFLTENKQKLQNRSLIRQCRIYKAMADKIPGRTSDQCRGHHRRMVQVYKSIDKILQKLLNNCAKTSKNNKLENSADPDEWTIQIKIKKNLKNLKNNRLQIKNMSNQSIGQRLNYEQNYKQGQNQNLDQNQNEIENQMKNSQQNADKDDNNISCVKGNKFNTNNKVLIAITLNIDKVKEW